MSSIGADIPRLQATDDAELTWQASMECYLTSSRPILFTPDSALFLRHYITTTGVMLPMPFTSNAFLDTLLPLACKDDMLMHSLLALGGAHLSCDRTLSNIEQVKESMLRHYIWTVQQIRKELRSFDTYDHVRTLRLASVLTLLCHVEVRLSVTSSLTFLTLFTLSFVPTAVADVHDYVQIISGEKNSFTFQHLNASGQLISSFTRDGLQALQNRAEVGFVLELHSYMVMANNLTPQGLVPSRTLPNDAALAIVHTIEHYGTCGVMYGGYRELFALIPQVSALFSRRLDEEKTVGVTPSPDLTGEADFITRKLSTWNLDEILLSPATSARARDQILIAEAIRHGIRIYLHAAMVGSTLPEEATAKSMRDSSDAIIGLIKTLEDQSWACNSLWTILMAGSCLTDVQRQSDLVDLLRNTRYRMDHLARSIEILEELWNNSDPLSFGPYGIFIVVQVHNPTFAII